jgi:hypothetical protein
MKYFLQIIRSWLPLATGITLVFFAIYGAVQQNYRSSADDPQVQIARDTANSLAQQANPLNLIPPTPVDIADSLATFTMLYDVQDHLLGTNALLDDQAPEVPNGVIDTARENGENRVSWQPKPGVRSAIVAVASPGPDGGVVIVGRSLREVEKREQNLGVSLMVGWAVTLLATLGVTALIALFPLRLRRE